MYLVQNQLPQKSENGYALHLNHCFTPKDLILKNSVDLVEKLKQIDISENSILSSYDIVSMYTSIDVSKSEQLLQNKLEKQLPSNRRVSNRSRH